MLAVSKFVSQLILILGLSLAALVGFGVQVYVIVCVLSMVVTAGLVVSARDDPTLSRGWWFAMLGVSVAFGVLWPTLPIIYAWGAAAQKRAASPIAREASRSSGSDASPPSGPSTPCS